MELPCQMVETSLVCLEMLVSYSTQNAYLPDSEEDLPEWDEDDTTSEGGWREIQKTDASHTGAHTSRGARSALPCAAPKGTTELFAWHDEHV